MQARILGRRWLRAGSLLPFVAALALPSLLAAQTPPPHVTHFSPEGVVKGARQVTARFSAPMVPLGDPRPASEAFEIICPEPGTARWVDSREWAYDFARNLPAGVRCTFRVRAGLTTLDGVAVGGRREFTFSSGGPAVLDSSLPRAGAEWIDEQQAFVLVLDAPVDEATVLAHTHFVVEGLASQVGARLVTGADRQAILASRGKALPSGPIVVVQARQRFPNGARVTLVWGKGISTVSGVATVQDPEIPRGRQRVAFEADGGEPGLHWVLDGVELSLAPSPFLWEPRPGRHTLALRDADARLRDAVTFEVRGRR